MGCIQSRQVPDKTEFPEPSRPADEVEREEAVQFIRQRAVDAIQEADRAAAIERRMKEKVIAAERRALKSAALAERAKQHAHRCDDPDFDPLYVESEEDFSITPEPEKEDGKMSVRDAAAMFEGLASSGGGFDEKRTPRKLCMPGAFKGLDTFVPENPVDDFVKPPPGGIIFPDEKYIYNPNVRVKAFTAPTSPITPPTAAQRAPLSQHDKITHVNGVPVIHEPDQNDCLPKDVKQQPKIDVIQKVAEPEFKYSPSSPVSPTPATNMSSATTVNTPIIPSQWVTSPTVVIQSPPKSPSQSIPPIECAGAVEPPLVTPSLPIPLEEFPIAGVSSPEVVKASSPVAKVEAVTSSPPLPAVTITTPVASPKSVPMRENKATADVLVTRSPRLNAKLAAYEALDAEARAGPPPPDNLFIGQGRRVSGNLAKYEALDAAARAGPPPPDSTFMGQGRRVSGNLAKYEALDAEAKYEALDAEARAPLPPPSEIDPSHQGHTVRQRLAWSDGLEISKDEYGDDDFGHHSVKQIERRQQELFERAGIRATREKLPAKVESPPPQPHKVGRLSGMLAMYEAKDRAAEEEQRIESVDRRMIVAAKTRASLSSS